MENESDSDAVEKLRKFSDLNGLTDFASNKKKDIIAEQGYNEPNSMIRGKIATKDDFQEDRDHFKHLDSSDEKIWDKSSKEGSSHPDNLNAVHSEDIQKRKGLKGKNKEAKWSSAEASGGVEVEK